jgi:2-oxo-4-hydroxy-4-carboxy-5-ureidoimidazoline decarboxylase
VVSTGAERSPTETAGAVAGQASIVLSIDVLDTLPPDEFIATVAPLFEGAPAFLRRLAAARPYKSVASLFESARSIAHSMPVAEQIELIDAHPRLGAPPQTVSAASFVEQGYATEAATRAALDANDHRVHVAAELERLNAAYEARFGFRYCVFVAGRPRAELLPDMATALEAGRDAEIHRALDAVLDIAMDRFAKKRDDESTHEEMTGR